MVFLEFPPHFEHYMSANDVIDIGKKWSILLSTCGAATYKLIRNLTSPELPVSKTYKEIVDLVQTHYQPKPSVMIERLKFNSRIRQTGESVSTFMTELRQSSKHCDFGESLNDMLRDKLVCGINDSRIQRRLLSELNLTFQKAFDLALAMEIADKDTQGMQKATRFQHSDVHVLQPKSFLKKSSFPVSSRSSSTTGSHCYPCGTSHAEKNCWAKEVTCYYCHKKGHIAKVCRTKRNHSTQGRLPLKTNFVHTSSEIEESSYSLFTLGNSRSAHLMVELCLNKKPVQWQVDTGAVVSVISYSTFQNLWDQTPTLKKSLTKLQTYTGEEINVLGSFSTTASYKGQEEDFPLLVVEGYGPSLLGRNWLSRIKLDWKEINLLRSGSTQLQTLLQKYSNVFKTELGIIRGSTIDLPVSPDAKPKFLKARTVPYILKEKIETELDRLLSQGVIEPVKFAKWAAPIVPVVKADGTVRICGDTKSSLLC